MGASLERIFESLAAPPIRDSNQPAYSVASIGDAPDYFVGKDSDGKACILIHVDDGRDVRHRAPIRLESLEVQFEVRSIIRTGSDAEDGTFTIIRCRSVEIEIIRYFLSICETIIRILGSAPSRESIAKAVNKLALIFQRLRDPPSRTVNGLFGELFLIKVSKSPPRALAAWRTQDRSRFDFSAGDVRLDVKTTAGRARVHDLTYDQCNPPPGTVGLAASLFAERTSGGVSMGELIIDIERMLGRETDLIIKLHTIVVATLGGKVQEALSIRFDQHLAASSMQFYELRTIPAIRGNIPPGVSDIHFRSDLSGANCAELMTLSAQHSTLCDLLPRSVAV